MKNNSLEKVFQEKLGQLRIEPTEHAKALFNQKLHKKKRIIRSRRLSIAASVLILMSLSIYVLLPEIKDVTQAKNEPAPEIEQTKVVANEEAISEKEKEQSGDKINNEINDNQYNVRQSDVIRQLNDDLAVKMPGGTRVEEQPDNPSVTDQVSGFPDESPLTGHPVSSTIEKRALSVPQDTETVKWENVSHDMPLREVESIALEDETDDSNNTITIEYIPSGIKKEESEQVVSALYEKMNNLVYPNELLGDIRSFKDQVFAFEYIREIRIKNVK